MRAVPASSLNFAFKAIFSPIFHNNESTHPSYFESFMRNVSSGSAAGASSLLFVYSLDLARTRLSNDSKSASTAHERQFKNMRDVYRQVLAKDGARGLYTGFLPGVLGIIFYRGLYFGIYDSLKPLVLTDSSSFAASFALAYASTTIAELTAYPLDTIKRRMMLTAGEAKKYRGMIHAARHIMQRDGVNSLFKGSFVNILRGISGALCLSLYDKLIHSQDSTESGDEAA